jgi:hypothetical protein
VVTVACQSQAVQLLSASPNNGYQMRVESEGPTVVRVEFVSSGGGSQIDANCLTGRPQGNIYNDE